MLPVERVIGEEGLSISEDGGLKIAMRLPWYRSLPFSTVEISTLTLDGKLVDLASALIEYNGESWSMATIGEKVDSFWFVQDSAFLVVPKSGLNSGGEHEVSLTITVNPPYIPGMKRQNPQTALLRVNG